MVDNDKEVDDPAVTDVEPRVAVTPAGTPLSDSATLWALPEVTAVDTVVVAVPPWITAPEAGDADTEKLLPVRPTVGPAISQAPLAFDQVACMAKDPVDMVTF